MVVDFLVSVVSLLAPGGSMLSHAIIHLVDSHRRAAVLDGTDR
jgi:cyclopropane fatty-acyl-phospholipid synthase-like methyltransferase